MHRQALRAVARYVDTHRLNQPDRHVVEIGAYNVNGSVRGLFAACASYTGVDVRSGPGVDVVADGAEWGETAACDVVVTTETLEHSADPAAIVANAARILRPGGALLITAAAPGRGPHGNDGATLPPGEAYQNIDPADLRAWLEAAGFERVEIGGDAEHCDVYACAFLPVPDEGASRGRRGKGGAA